MTLQELFRGLARSALTLLVFLVIGLAAAVAYVKLTRVVYTARTQIYVNASDDDGSLSDNLNGSQLARNDAPSFALIARSPMVLSPVAATFHLTEAQLASEVTTSVPPNTTVIQIDVADHSGQTAARIAAALDLQSVTTIQSLQSSSGLSTQSSIRLDIVQSATVPTTPSSPQPVTDLITGGIVGFGVGVIAAAARGTLTPRKRSPAADPAVTAPAAPPATAPPAASQPAATAAPPSAPASPTPATPTPATPTPATPTPATPAAAASTPRADAPPAPTGSWFTKSERTPDTRPSGG